MDTTANRLVLALLFVTVAAVQAANDMGLQRVRRSHYFGQPFAMPRKRHSHSEAAEEKRGGYIAFPRLGRGYLALPRMGRSQPGSDDMEHGASCCKVELKKEWLFDEDGKMNTQNVCQFDFCCVGLKEVENTKPDGTFYTMCIPGCSSEDSEH